MKKYASAIESKTVIMKGSQILLTGFYAVCFHPNGNVVSVLRNNAYYLFANLGEWIGGAVLSEIMGLEIMGWDQMHRIR